MFSDTHTVSAFPFLDHKCLGIVQSVQGSILRCLLLASLAAGFQTNAFSLLGPRAVWMTRSLGYELYGIPGGPMNVGDEYRWNLPEITYGFDRSFTDYFGERGVAEVEKAVMTLNAALTTPEVALSSYPLSAAQHNSVGAVSSLLDLGSTALAALLEQLGLASPEADVFCLRDRFDGSPSAQYAVVFRNFDPYTAQPSTSVNGTQFTYRIVPDFGGTNIAHAVTLAVDPLAPLFSSVAGSFARAPMTGLFFKGLSRDDVAGLRYLHSSDNLNWESLPRGMDWQTAGGGQPVLAALRPGVGTVRFKRVFLQSQAGQRVFHTFTDRYSSNGVLSQQRVTRSISAPDITFSARDLGPYVMVDRTVGARANNGVNAGAEGPGVIEPGGVITFNKVGPIYVNSAPPFTEQDSGYYAGGWGSFDDSSERPFKYPAPASAAAKPATTLKISDEPQPDGSRALVWQFIGTPGHPYRIYASEDLQLWEPIRTVSGTDGRFEFRQAETVGTTQVFFRLAE